jgi:hypothetical protein
MNERTVPESVEVFSETDKNQPCQVVCRFRVIPRFVKPFTGYHIS